LQVGAVWPPKGKTVFKLWARRYFLGDYGCKASQLELRILESYKEVSYDASVRERCCHAIHWGIATFGQFRLAFDLSDALFQVLEQRAKVTSQTAVKATSHRKQSTLQHCDKTYMTIGVAINQAARPGKSWKS
jgi:hypothetical protein